MVYILIDHSSQPISEWQNTQLLKKKNGPSSFMISLVLIKKLFLHLG